MSNAATDLRMLMSVMVMDPRMRATLTAVLADLARVTAERDALRADAALKAQRADRILARVYDQESDRLVEEARLPHSAGNRESGSD